MRPPHVLAAVPSRLLGGGMEMAVYCPRRIPMNSLSNLIGPATWALAGLATLLSLAGIPADRRALRLPGRVVLLLATICLIAPLAHPQLLPAGSAVFHPDGGTDDPRVVSALLVGVAAIASLLPAWASLGLTAMGWLSLALPGIVLAGLLGAVASFAGLHQPMALAGVAIGAFGGGTAIMLAVRAVRAEGGAAASLQALATCLLVVAGMLSLHGVRARTLKIVEGAAVDTLGQRVAFTRVDAPRSDLRVLHFVLFTASDSALASPELRGPLGREVQSVAAGSFFSGPVLVPIALEERRAKAHDITWLAKGTPLQAGNASIVLTGFRFVPGDTIRMYADLDVTTASGTERVSPGVYASSKGETPFAAQARGFGPIALAGIDADHGRVGLMLPTLSDAPVMRTAAIDLRMRPALPVAWAGAALALLAFVFSLLAPGTARPRR
jgi:hypothetical protein